MHSEGSVRTSNRSTYEVNDEEERFEEEIRDQLTRYQPGSRGEYEILEEEDYDEEIQSHSIYRNSDVSQSSYGHSSNSCKEKSSLEEGYNGDGCSDRLSQPTHDQILNNDTYYGSEEEIGTAANNEGTLYQSINDNSINSAEDRKIEEEN